MKLIGIIGKPLAHSLSPRLFSAIFKKQRLSFRYLPFQVEKKDLKNLMVCMKLVDVVGLNVTSPYKEAVVPFLDRLDASAKSSGAVNTIVRKKNRFVGYNTDGAGFLLSLAKQKKTDPGGKVVAIVGAGGAARGIAAALAAAKTKQIIFLNRSPGRAKKVASFFRKQFPKTTWNALPLTHQSCSKIFPVTDILVQTTPSSPQLPLQLLSRRSLICDVVYRPVKTELLLSAQEQNLDTLDGLWMLLHQANLNLKRMTGKTTPLAWLRRIALKERGMGNLLP